MQVEKLSNELLDSCDQFRESMGEVTDNVSLAVALETLWSERIENSSSGMLSPWGPPVLSQHHVADSQQAFQEHKVSEKPQPESMNT